VSAAAGAPESEAASAASASASAFALLAEALRAEAFLARWPVGPESAATSGSKSIGAPSGQLISWAVLPASASLASAERVNAWAWIVTPFGASPPPRILTGIGLVFWSRRSWSWRSTSGVMSVPAAASLMRPRFSGAYSTRKRFLKPCSFGVRMWSGVWPPSNQAGIPPPARDFWPFVPRPAVFPRPEPWPRPRRRGGWCEPGFGWGSCSFI
jgi:hypothetical protein